MPGHIYGYPKNRVKKKGKEPRNQVPRKVSISEEGFPA